MASSQGITSSQTDNLKGILLAVVASAFIGSSFIVKKKGLKRAGASGPRASLGGYGYLIQPLWWMGMVTMIVGEVANFVAYIFAPAVLVTPLGALSIIVSAVLAHFLLNEKLQKMGILGCILCIVGSTMIVLHAPSERTLESVEEIWGLATQPAFLFYTALAFVSVLVLMFYCAVWSDKHISLHWHMLNYWITDGYERKSDRDCYKTYVGGYEPGHMLPDMDICYDLYHLCHYSAELFKQGEILTVVKEFGRMMYYLEGQIKLQIFSGMIRGGGESEEKMKICWMGWKRLLLPKEFGSS